MTSPLQILDWGLIRYDDALKDQEEILEQVAEHRAPQTLIFCRHPSVVTTGRATLEEDLQGWQGDLIAVTRGGRATYHGPGQVVLYPILDLRLERAKLPSRDIRRYLQFLGDTAAASLNKFKLFNPVEFRQGETVNGQHLTGLWIGEKKVGSIGVAVRKWITYHGLALNLERDSGAFKGIRPCGFDSGTMACLNDFSASKLTREMVQIQMVEDFGRALT